jgi:dTDP-4-amino-4,6-dideoxygalactose transaminase
MDTYYKELIKNTHSISVLGNEIEKFEKIMKDYFQVKHALLTSSGTTSLIIALKTIGAENKTIAIPSFSFISSVLAGLILSSKIKFVDTEKYSLCASAKSFLMINQRRQILLFLLILVAFPVIWMNS